MRPDRFSVFVDGTEVNDYYLTLEDAEYIADMYESDGYDKVEIVEKL